MPIEVKRLEPHIYLAIWHGNITREEILGGVMEGMARDNGDMFYVSILDSTEVESFPFNAPGLRRGSVVYSKLLVTLIVNPPLLGKVLVDLISRLTPLKFEYFDSVEKALARARVLVAEHSKRRAGC